MAVDHMAAFCYVLTEGIGEAHAAGLADNEGRTDEFRRLSRTVEISQVNVAKAALQQQKELLDAQLRDLGEDAVEEVEEEAIEEPSEEEEEEIDLIINVKADKGGELVRAAESEAPTAENEEPGVEGNATRDDGDAGMDAKDAEDAERFDVVLNGEEELQLPAVEFNPEVQERVGRWSVDLPSGSIT
jgi:hypothetical protein